LLFRSAAFGAVRGQLLAGRGGRGPTLRVANELFVRAGTAAVPAYAGLVEREYGGGVRALDFAGAPGGAVRAINAWVAEQTDGRIAAALARGAVSSQTVAVLANTVYLRAAWAHAFVPLATAPAVFHAAGSDVQVPTMYQSRRFRLGGDATVAVLELPYRDSTLVVDVLLPRAVDGVAALEAQVDPARLASWLDAGAEREVEVYLPRFRAAVRFEMADALRGLGARTAFDARAADLSGVATTRERLVLSSVTHAVTVDVDEAGTVAAAATVAATEVAGVAPARAVFRADHPFVYVIRDRATGLWLFLGRVARPRAA
jgi:serpin B